MSRKFVLVVIGAAVLFAAPPKAQQSSVANSQGEEIVVASGALQLKALLFRPDAKSLVPGVVFHHGSGCGAGLALAPAAARNLGNRFAKRGYAFLWLYRRGTGLSTGQGDCMMTTINRVRTEKGEDAAMDVQLQHLNTTEMDDAMAGLAALRGLPGIDTTRIVVGGHSFGGQLALLTGERDARVRAIVVAAGASLAWGRSTEIQARLLQTARAINVPIYLGYAEDDNAAAGRALGAELTRLKKPHVLAIYPTGGHGFIFNGDHPSDAEMFRFLSEHVSKPSTQSP